jgi:alkylation response protein AidB-like acyl-CoA dehydrogenase
VAQTALDGAWWGTVASEPGTGGDLRRSFTRARPVGNEAYVLSGQKHFGSGSGITTYMITNAMPDGEASPDLFYIDVRHTAWHGSTGMKLVAEWDGHGMTATQSHAFEFSEYPATRLALPPDLRTGAGGPVLGPAAFTSVIVGVVQSAVSAARSQLMGRKDMRPYEQVEWAHIENEAWLIDQAYEGMLRSVDEGRLSAATDALHAKTAIATLAESLTTRVCRVTVRWFVQSFVTLRRSL